MGKYFFLLLAKILKNFGKKWRFCLQCAFWDRMTAMRNGKNNVNDIVNCGKLMSDCISANVLSIAVLKKMDILSIEPKQMLFANTVLSELLLSRNQVFSALRGNDKLKGMRRDLEVFFNSILIPRTKQKINELKHNHAEMQKKNEIFDTNQLTKIGLELRENENLLFAIKNALTQANDVQIKESVYNQLIY